MEDMNFTPSASRYQTMKYNQCGNSGIKLPAVSMGLWHNFGYPDNFDTARQIVYTAFNSGITHFDLANNYGPPYGAAEYNFGRILKSGLKAYRHELVISTKAGYDMWPGPYGNGGSRKYLITSCEQSLKRMGVDYVDIFYSHRFDPETPIEETMGALDTLVKQGKALYAGISNYNPQQTLQATQILENLGTRCLIHQFKYSMLERTPEQGLLNVLQQKQIGGIVFSPLAQGLLTNKYLNGIPEKSRAASQSPFLNSSSITPQLLSKLNKLNIIAQNRQQSLAQMALAWLLNHNQVTSVLVGASSVEQLLNNIDTIKNTGFTNTEIQQIDTILNL